MRNLPTHDTAPDGTATAVQLAERMGRSWRQVKLRLARRGAPQPVGILKTTTGGAYPWLYPIEAATEWLVTTPDGDTIHDVAPEGTVTVAELGRRFGRSQSSIKTALRKPDAPAHVGRLRAASHPRLYLLAEVEAFLGAAERGVPLSG